ncbi:MAG: hypothetical protein U9Q66_02090 [Patescibacteria group bacterium]|nr:hypothetical protein [Patescibacteria group bacterium]
MADHSALFITLGLVFLLIKSLANSICKSLGSFRSHFFISSLSSLFSDV